MVRIPFISAGVAVLLMTGAVMAQSRGLTVELDHSARIQLAGSASSVIVGNPRIADVTVVNDRTLFVSGRGHGVTDVIVVDALGRTIYNGQISVIAPRDGQVRVWRGTQATEMACGAGCAPAVSGGQAAAATP